MTREEAKTVFLNRGYVEVEGGTIYDADKWREACRVISEWLEQEPSGDLISRQDAIDALREAENHAFNSYYKGLKKAHKIIAGLPSVKPQESCDVPDMNDGDMISRQAVDTLVDELARAISDERCCISRGRSTATIMQDILDLPSVKPQEPCDVPDINVGDIISKQTVLDTISELNAISFYEAQEDSRETYYEIRQAIKDLSPVKQEPKTGHWIVHPKGIYAHLICDKCLSNAPYDCRTDYCPSCGAKMIEPQESEDKERSEE